MITINPILNNVKRVNAEGEPATQVNTTGEPTAQANTEPTVSLTLTSGEAYQQTTAEAGKVVYRSNIFKVGGSGIADYIVSLNTASGKTGELVGENNQYAIVGKVDVNTTPANFGDNTWGYAVSTLNNTSVADTDMTYNPVPSGTDGNNNVDIANRRGIATTTTVADSYKITFAAKLGNDLPADHYQADVYLSVVASPKTTISRIRTMQDMNSNICASSTVSETKQLVDTRDGKSYWVTKLDDQKCWMTQNLDYDIKVGDFASAVATRTDGIDSGWSGTNAQVQSWDPGTYYYKYVSSWDNCGDKQASLSGCIGKGNWTVDMPAAEGKHYHVGNYYSWNAATAGTGGSITSGQASSSVCPTGWRLPTSEGSTADFGNLMSAYGLTGSNVDKIRKAPIYFIPSGLITTDGMNVAGSAGYYWSSTPHSSDALAYSLSFASNSLSPSSYSGPRFLGYSVRCVAQ